MIVNQKKMSDLAEHLLQAEEVQGRSLWADAYSRFHRNKAALTGVITLVLVVLFALIGPLFAQYSNEEIDWAVIGQVKQLGAPSFTSGHYFGTDDLGRDLFARVIQGTTVSLMVGFIGSFVAVIVGTLYGAVAGYTGGRVDNFMMRLVDILMSIPYMFVLIIMLVIFGRSIEMLFLGIGLVSWFDMSRIVRGQTLSIKNKEYIEAAIAAGVSNFTIILRHIVPNLIGIVVVYASLLVPGFIMAESFISFLGLGIQEPATSWGALINQGSRTMQYGTLWQLLFPLFFFVITLFSMFFIGDGLRDALDPKDR